MRGLLAVVLMMLSGAVTVRAQGYDPQKTFATLTMPDPVNSYRSANGAPGPRYWQNNADYELHAKIDPAAKVLSGDEIITYTNNSPDALTSLWIQLDQNTYRHDARSIASRGRERDGFTDGYVLDAVEIDTAGRAQAAWKKATYVVADTRMQIQLATALPQNGAKMRVHIRYHFTIPGTFGGRMSWGSTKNGEIFDMAQWYPRMCVYDDLHGWDTLPFLAQEFYLEYGHFDYYVTVPAEMLVAGSGELMNAAEVLTSAQMSRLAKARASDKTVVIRGVDEVQPQSFAGKVKTWHYRMDSTRDVAFSASSAFVWDAARMNLPAGKHALAMSFYPVESAGDAAWGRSTEYLKDAVERYSAKWFVYPYPVAVNVAGPSSGMEYPGMLFDGIDDAGKDLFWITAHEIGHTWFPMIVGFNERRNAWMDEGFNTFIDTFESDEFEGGVYGPKRDSEFAPGGGNPADEIVPIMQDAGAPPILTRADVIPEKYRHNVTYFKSALGLSILREQILGPERFDFAFRKFIKDWAFKHPSPSDFFRAMESEGGEDLSYFWRGWYMNNWTLDFAVDGVQKGKDGVIVTIGTHGQLVLPCVVELSYADGTKERMTLPAETWIQHGTYGITINAPKKLVGVVIDPEHKLPDVERGNNSWIARK